MVHNLLNPNLPMKRFAIAALALVTPMIASAHPGHPGHDFEWGYTPVITGCLVLVGLFVTGVVLRRRTSR